MDWRTSTKQIWSSLTSTYSLADGWVTLAAWKLLIYLKKSCKIYYSSFFLNSSFASLLCSIIIIIIHEILLIFAAILMKYIILHTCDLKSATQRISAQGWECKCKYNLQIIKLVNKIIKCIFVTRAQSRRAKHFVFINQEEICNTACVDAVI